MYTNDSHDPDLLLYKSGGGCLALFGLPFLCSGLSVMLLPFFNFGGGQSAPWIFCIPFGAIFVTVGFGLVFGKSKISIDRRMGLIRSVKSAIVTFKSEELDLKQFNMVVINQEVRSSGKSSYTVYPVRIAGENIIFDLEEPRVYAEARMAAEKIAKFAGFSMKDSCGGNEIIRTVEELDETIRDRMRKLGEDINIPPVPEHTKLEYDVGEREFMVTMPPSGCLFFTILPALVGVGMSYGFYRFALAIIRDVRELSQYKVYILGACFIPLLAAVVAFYRALTLKVKVIASSREFRFIKSSAFGKKEQVIPSTEFEELELVGGGDKLKEALDNSDNKQLKDAQQVSKMLNLFAPNFLRAKSDAKIIDFGNGLSKQELVWIKALIEKMVSL